MNALLWLRANRPHTPRQTYLATRDVTVTCSALHDARGKSLALLMWEICDRWEANDPDGDVLPYVRATVARG